MNDLAVLAEAVVAELGTRWRLEPPDPREGRVLVVHADGRRLVVRFTDSARPTRVEVRGVLPSSPHGTPHGVHSPAITIATCRGAAVIAKEIHRRLLPTYTATLARVRVFQAARAHEDARRHQLAQQIRSILPNVRDGYHRYWGGLPTHTVLSWNSADSHGRFMLGGAADLVDLELHQIPRQTLVQICCLLAAQGPPGPPTCVPAPSGARGPADTALLEHTGAGTTAARSS